MKLAAELLGRVASHALLASSQTVSRRHDTVRATLVRDKRQNGKRNGELVLNMCYQRMRVSSNRSGIGRPLRVVISRKFAENHEHAGRSRRDPFINHPRDKGVVRG